MREPAQMRIPNWASAGSSDASEPASEPMPLMISSYPKTHLNTCATGSGATPFCGKLSKDCASLALGPASQWSQVCMPLVAPTLAVGKTKTFTVPEGSPVEILLSTFRRHHLFYELHTHYRT